MEDTMFLLSVRTELNSSAEVYFELYSDINKAKEEYNNLLSNYCSQDDYDFSQLDDTKYCQDNLISDYEDLYTCRGTVLCCSKVFPDFSISIFEVKEVK